MNETRLVQVDKIAALLCLLNFNWWGHKLIQCSLTMLVLVVFPSLLNPIFEHPSHV